MAARSLMAFVGLVAALAASPAASADALDLYTIEGYMDRAPSQADIIGRVEVSEPKAPARYLLVTACRSSRPTRGDRERAHATQLRGRSEEVSRLLGVPMGAAVKLTFAVYVRPVTSLLIVELDDHVA